MKNTAKGGVIVELYYNDDDSNKVDYVVILNYSIAQIDDVSTKLTKAQKDDGATCKIKVDGSYYTSDKVTGFNAKTYVEDAYLLYVVNGNKIVASQVAEAVKGKVSAIKGDKATIDGTSYKVVNTKDVAISDEGTFYLNVADQIAATDTTSKSDKYAYIYNLKVDTNKVNSDGVQTTTYTAYYVTVDGTKASAVVDIDNVEAIETTGLKREAGVYYADTKVKVEKDKVIAFSINSDKELVYEAAKDTIATSKNTTAVIDKTHAQGTDSSTQFIFTWAKNSTQKVETKVGFKNVDIDASKTGYWTVTNSDGDILYVFVSGENATISSDAKLAVLLDNEANISENKDGDEVYTYAVAINGEETTLTFKDGDKLSDSKYVKGYVFAYTVDGDYAKVDATETGKINNTTAKTATKDYFTNQSDDQFNLADADAIYTITVEYKKSAKVDVYASTFVPAKNTGNIDTVTVSEGGKVDKGDYVTYTVDSNNLKVLFVYDFIG